VLGHAKLQLLLFGEQPQARVSEGSDRRGVSPREEPELADGDLEVSGPIDVEEHPVVALSSEPVDRQQPPAKRRTAFREHGLVLRDAGDGDVAGDYRRLEERLGLEQADGLQATAGAVLRVAAEQIAGLGVELPERLLELCDPFAQARQVPLANAVGILGRPERRPGQRDDRCGCSQSPEKARGGDERVSLGGGRRRRPPPRRPGCRGR
jgi:hypothetical protein